MDDQTKCPHCNNILDETITDRENPIFFNAQNNHENSLEDINQEFEFGVLMIKGGD